MFRYLSEQDTEDLFLVSGFSLSRAHVQKVVKRWARHEKISYRYITDQLIDKASQLPSPLPSLWLCYSRAADAADPRAVFRSLLLPCIVTGARSSSL